MKLDQEKNPSTPTIFNSCKKNLQLEVSSPHQAVKKMATTSKRDSLDVIIDAVARDELPMDTHTEIVQNKENEAAIILIE